MMINAEEVSSNICLSGLLFFEGSVDQTRESWGISGFGLHRTQFYRNTFHRKDEANVKMQYLWQGIQHQLSSLSCLH